MRHPLAFLVEAADDICYRIIDYEDGFRVGRIPFEEIRDDLLQIVDAQAATKRLKSIRERQDQVSYLRSKAIDSLVRQTAHEFLKREAEVLNGTFDEPLIEKIQSINALRTIKQKSKERVYSAPSVVEIEAAGFEVLGGLLEIFVGAATELATATGTSARSKKILELLPPRHRQAEPDPYQRLLRIVDHVASMTDSYAVAQYRKIKGMSLSSS